MKINQQKLENAYEAIKGAFFWTDSSQGHDYWKNIADELENLGATPKQIKVNITEEVDIVLANQFCDSLSNAFVWSNSPQGHNYWEDVYVAMEEIIHYGLPLTSKKDDFDPVKSYERAMKGV